MNRLILSTLSRYSSLNTAATCSLMMKLMICRYKHLLLVRRGRLERREQVAAQNVQIERLAEVLGLVLVDEEHQVARLGLGLGRGLDVSDDDRVAPVLLALQVCSQPRYR